ncbi:MAG: ABC transporter permease [Candidatus Omnitrophica bacterium]|nr:ABC transporter permease [Candidatus Omnitrophota bacterium]
MSIGRIKSLYAYRHSLWDLAVKQFKSRYANSLLGIWLAIVNPLLIMLAVTFVFSVIFKIEIEDFPFFALAGIFPWMFFSGALSEATNSILNQKSMLRQFNLPGEIIPISSILSNFLNFLVGWCLIYPVFLFFNPKIIKLFPFVVVLFLLHFLFICGLGLIFSCLNVFFRDIGLLLGVFLMFWFWVTPIFYSIEMVPGDFRWICNINPMTPFIVFYRDVFFQGNIPPPLIWNAVWIWTVLSLILGFSLFAKFEARLLKEI